MKVLTRQQQIVKSHRRLATYVKKLLDQSDKLHSRGITRTKEAEALYQEGLRIYGWSREFL